MHKTDQEFREELIQKMMSWRDCDRVEAEIIMSRIGSRLEGFTHEEVTQMHPLEDSAR